MAVVVVIDTDRAALEGVTAQRLERVALDDRRAREAEAGKVEVELLAAAVAHRPVVERDELAGVAEHRGDQARAAVGADLHVRLAFAEAARSDVQEREVVRLREARDGFEHLGEAEVARLVAEREVVELGGELAEKAIDVHRASLKQSGA